MLAYLCLRASCRPRCNSLTGSLVNRLIKRIRDYAQIKADGRITKEVAQEGLAWLGIDEATFYDPRHMAILPMGFCFPGLDAKGSDLPPRPECAPAWRAQLMGELPNIDLVVCLGAHAMRWHMRQAWPGSVDAAVKDWRKGLTLTPAVIPLPHPSWRNSGWLKRNPWFAEALLPELKDRVARLLALAA